jgi:hypothetical protein
MSMNFTSRVIAAMLVLTGIGPVKTTQVDEQGNPRQ